MQMRSVGIIRPLLVLVLLLTAAASMDAPAKASNKQGSYNAWGAGNISCGKWFQDRRFDPGSAAFTPNQQTVDLVTEKSWVVGFLSAFNRYGWTGIDVASETDFDGLYAWIDTYCTAHPNERLSVATEALIATLQASPHPNAK